MGLQPLCSISSGNTTDPWKHRLLKWACLWGPINLQAWKKIHEVNEHYAYSINLHAG